MIKWICLAFMVLTMGCKVTSTYTDEDMDIESKQKVENLNFPESWKGKYVGELEIFNLGIDTAVQKVEMELIIDQIDSDSSKYEWNIIYGKDKIKGLRQYQLLVKNQQKGEYIIDERNSILLDAQFMNGRLMSRFSVMGNLILASYRKEGNYIYFEILSGNEKQKAKTGGKDDIPEVGNYGLNVSQIAKLRKIIVN